MKDEEYWKFGKKEIICVVVCTFLAAGLSAFLHLPPPWWLLPVPGNRAVRRAFWRSDLYASQGGYEYFWLQSLWGWMIVGAIVGLVFSNVKLRGKSGLFD